MPKGDITLLGRVRSSLRVRAAIDAGETQAAAILGRLGRLEGGLPPANPAGIVFASCDDRYFRPYALHLARSALRFSPAQGCHLHLVDPSAGTLRLAEALRSRGRTAGRFSYSFERTATAADPVRAGQVRYIICTRFARVWQLLLATGSPVVALDADSLVRRPLTALVGHCAGADVGLSLRPRRREPWRRVLGTALVALPTGAGRRFMRDCAVALADAAHHGPQLATDQMVLHQVWQWHIRHRPGFRVARLGREHSDGTCGESSLVWHAEGGRKSLTTVFERLAAGEPLEAVLGTAPGDAPATPRRPASAATLTAPDHPAFAEAAP